MLRSIAASFAAWCLWAPAGTSAQTAAFALAGQGCAMAHCDPSLSDRVNSVAPAGAALVAVDAAAAGARAGLGCASNTRIVACTRGGDPPEPSNLVAYDADGRQIWNDGGLLGPTAWMSVPMVAGDGSIIAADQHWILRADPIGGRVVWKARKPDAGKPISPVPLGADAGMVLLATFDGDDGATPEISVWDTATGQLLWHQALVDPVSAKVYATRNTPAVQGQRAYILAEAVDDESDGRLYAVDVCNAPGCGPRGAMAVRWHYPFTGPSAASPLVMGSRIFFDGRPNPQTGRILAVADQGSTASLLWSRSFAAPLGASAAQDPRGGLWVFPWKSDAILRLAAASGAVQQKVSVSGVLGLALGYSRSSAVSVSKSRAGAVVLTLGATSAGDAARPSYVAAIDVSSTPGGSLEWLYRLAPNQVANAAVGQFPIVIGASGARRVVFVGSNSSTFFVGEP